MIPREQVEGWIREAVDQLPGKIRLGIQNVAFILEDRTRLPRRGEVTIEQHHVLLGLYHGVPLSRRGGNYTMVPPDTITIFQEAIELVAAGDPAKVRQQVMDTVWHEIAHYLGMNEAEVRGWERRRRGRRAGGRSQT